MRPFRQDETLLDLLRSQIYELRTTIEKREAAAQQKERSEASVRSQQEVLEECQELVAGRKQGLAGAFGTAAAGAVFVLLSKTVANAEIFSSEKASMLAGAATLVFGALLIIGSFLKALRETGKWGKQGRELHKVKVALENYEEQAEQDAEVYEELDQTMKELRHRLTETFQTSEDATPEELEACWQQERKRSQEYQQLKAECESRRNASRDAKEICQSYLNDHPKAAEPLPGDGIYFPGRAGETIAAEPGSRKSNPAGDRTNREPDSHAGRGNSEIAGAGRAGCSVDCTD